MRGGYSCVIKLGGQGITHLSEDVKEGRQLSGVDMREARPRQRKQSTQKPYGMNFLGHLRTSKGGCDWNGASKGDGSKK